MATVTLGADVGGEDADGATSEVCMDLRRSLAKECCGPYGESFAQFALVLRIDGSVHSWQKSGVDHVRLQRKSKYATADIFVPRSAWASGTDYFRSFLASGVEAAIEAIVVRARASKCHINSDQLIRDVKRATRMSVR